jgi:phytoene dehydrogenase-like protein
MGASLPLAMAAEARAKSLGAEFAYRCGAKRLVLEDGRATGIELEDGRVQRARAIVSACDARWTFDSLLGSIVKDPTYEAMFEEREIYGGIVQLSLGFETDPAWGLADAPKRMVFPIGSTLIVDGREQTMISIYQYSADPGMAPPGRTVLVARFEADYDRWKRLLADPAAYRAEKKRILADTVRALEARFPGMKTRIEASDVSTPTSCERYTGNWRGSTQGWLMTPERMKKMMAGKRLPRSFPEVPGLYLAGQWTEPGGGLPPCVKTGREAIRAILKAKAKLEKE